MVNFILTAYITKLEHYNNQINHENLRNHCIARGSDNFFLQNNIMPEIQNLIVHNMGYISIKIYLINHASAETLNIVRKTPSGTNSPPAEISINCR
jgi:hypothetical protein